MNSAGQNRSSVNSVPARAHRILVADDEILIRTLLTEVLTEDGYEVTTAEDGAQAIALLEKERFDLAISDIVMPRANGIEVLLAARQLDPECPVIMITGYPSVDTVIRLVRLGSADYITKPFNVDLIKLTVAKILEMKNIKGKTQCAETPQQSSSIDQTTKTYNGPLFLELLHGEVGRSARRGHECSLLLSEIDRFAEANNKGGLSVGDELLKVFAGILKKESNPGDIIGRTDRAELGLILPETDRNEANLVAQSIRKKAEWSFTISVGVAAFPRDASNPEALFNTARQAMKAAKARGGNTILLPR